MTKRWLGIAASKEGVIYVDVEVPDNKDDPLRIITDDTWKVQRGDRSAAYNVLHQQCADYIRENHIEIAIVKASAVTGKGTAKLGMLEAAEVRGVVIAAAASACRVRQMKKGSVSKTYGDRNVDEYVADDSFWTENTKGGKLRKMSRETTMLLIAARNG